ncbi:MAG: D-amino acid aminotransferase [Burkholderiaceae bacterium]
MSSIQSLPCYLNGEFSTLDKANISVMDRGFIFGDGIYEVVPVYGGRPFRFAEHMARLERSLAEIRIPNLLDRAGWLDLVRQLVDRHAQSIGQAPSDINQLIYIHVTRGVAMRDHAMPSDIKPTIFAMVNSLKAVSSSDLENGVHCVSEEDFRWKKAHIKSTSLLGAVLSRQISADVGATETIMFRDGDLSEAAASNVWVVKDGKVFGPPKDNLVLEGIRYGLMAELCQQEGLAFELRRISRAEVLDADELMLSSATKELLPVTRLDDSPVGSGKPGPIFKRLYARYQQAKAAS